jgi:hypothetical protein
MAITAWPLDVQTLLKSSVLFPPTSQEDDLILYSNLTFFTAELAVTYP